MTRYTTQWHEEDRKCPQHVSFHLFKFSPSALPSSAFKKNVSSGQSECCHYSNADCCPDGDKHSHTIRQRSISLEALRCSTMVLIPL
ncbi:hypothetical protein BDF14DRAFT_1854289 [Spinellus fusiger]|nr:hypothetical protein BDF14DRAFT_1854289 [Spinellus fusiger]